MPSNSKLATAVPVSASPTGDTKLLETRQKNLQQLVTIHFKNALRTVFLILILSFYSLTFSQTINPREFKYSLADSIALNIPKDSYQNIPELATLLTKNLSTEHEKFRVIFRWITNNIVYSFSNRTDNAEIVFKKRKAVCAGYASLLKSLCDNVRIECKIIAGNAKIYTKEIGFKFSKTDHAWNTVKINGIWYLVDATWASGSYGQKFIKEYDNSYFLADPKFLILSHFPEDKRYQYIEPFCKKKDFIKYPISYSDKISLIGKPIGKIKKKLNLKFMSTENIKKITLAFETDKYSRKIEFKINEGYYEIGYTFKPTDKGGFTLFVDSKAVFGFVKK